MDENGSNWQDRCERYFTSLTDSDKQRQKDKKMKTKKTDKWKCFGHKSSNRPHQSKFQYWLQAIDIHGMRFAGSVRNSLECSVWILISIFASGALAFLVYMAINVYNSQNNHFQLKSVSSYNHLASTTFINVCNLNLLKKSSLMTTANRFSTLASINNGVFNPQPVAQTYDLLKNTALWPIIKVAMGAESMNFVTQMDHYFFPYSGMTKSDDWGSLYGASTRYGFGIWKDAVRPTKSELHQLGHKADDTVVECYDGNGKNCKLSVMETTFSELGNCATLNVSSLTDSVTLLLNSEPSESTSVLTSTNGISIQIYPAESSLKQARKHLVSNSQHLHIKNRKITSLLRQNDCSDSDTSIQECEENCLDILTNKYCQCHTDRKTDGQCLVNNKFQYVCSKSAEKLFYMGSLDCKCKPKCSEHMYETESSTLPWPTDQHLDHLSSYLQQKKFNKSTILSSLSYVSIDLRPGLLEELTEERSISLLDLLSKIGGLSALIVGMSIISVFQLFWLIIKLCFNAAVSGRSTTSEEVEEIANSDITSITWQAYKDKNFSRDPRPQRFSNPPEISLNRSNSRRSYLEPIAEERKPDHKPAELNRQDILEEQLFSHPWERTGQRRPYSTVINSNREGDEFPLFNYINPSRSTSPMPRCSTPDNSDYRSTARLMPADGDISLFPSRDKRMSPADAIKHFGASPASKYQYSGPFYL